MKISVVLLVTLLICLSYRETEARWNISEEEDRELEEQLKILNKKPVKSFPVGGDIYDCIEIHKQPAFDHPRLKNHKIRMNPTSLRATNTQPKMTLKRIDCPKGTVPIRRTSKDDLIRARRFMDKHFQTTHPLEQSEESLQHVVSRVIKNNSKFHGAEAMINVIKPGIINDQQSVSSRIWLENGYPSQLGDTSSIQVGWIASEELFHDYAVRSFAYWMTRKNGKKTDGCYNTLCPGFIQIDQHYPIDQVLTGRSEYQGPQYNLTFTIYQNADNKDWWFAVDTWNLGYWPMDIVPDIVKGAEQVSFGAVAQASVDGNAPPLGFARWPGGHLNESAFFAHITIYDENYHRTLPVGARESLINDCYAVVDYAGAEPLDETGYSVVLGGPGGWEC